MPETIINQPDVRIGITSDSLPVENSAQRVLICGLSDATAVAEDTPVEVTDVADAIAKFGADSMLTKMIQRFRRIAPRIKLFAMRSADTGGTAQTRIYSLAGTATQSGTIELWLGSKRNHRLVVAIPAGTAAADAAALVNAAVPIGAADALFTCSVSTAELTFTSKVTDAAGAWHPFYIGNSVPGLTLSAGPTAETAAAGVANYTPFTNVTTRFQTIVWPWVDSTPLDALTDFLEPLWAASNVIRDGVGVTMLVDTYANCLAGVQSRNEKTLVLFVEELASDAVGASNQQAYEGPAIPEPPEYTLAEFAAIRAIRLEADTPIGQWVTSRASKDQYGGPGIAALPYFNTPMHYSSLPYQGKGWSDDEIENLRADGGAVFGQNLSGTAVILGEIPTTYTQDGSAIADVTFSLLNYVDTQSQIREYMQLNARAAFAQSRLTSGRVLEGRAMVNDVIIQSAFEQWYQELASSDYALVVGGEAAFRAFKQTISVALDLATGTATVEMEVPIVTQLRALTATIKVVFSTT